MARFFEISGILNLTLLNKICHMCGFPLRSNIWHDFSSKKHLILKAIILQNQSVSYFSSANRKTAQNESEKKKFIFFLKIF